MNTKYVLSLLGVVLGLLVCSGSAFAQEPAATAGSASGALGLRFGTDDLNLGFGGRIGYTLDMNVYVGGMGEYFLGEEEGGVSFSAWMIGAEVGYDLGLTPEFVIRPELLLALAGVSVEVCSDPGFGGGTQCIDGGDEELDIGLGAVALYDVGGIQIGGELRYMLKELEALILGVNVGATF